MAELHVGKAQRKAMHDALDDAIDQLMTLVGVGVSIPEGAPVGTIARRPDGEWIAWRTEDGWGYRFIGDEEPNEWPPGSSIADFWPVIYDPREYEGTEYDPETGLHWFKPGEEPLVPRPDPHGTVNLDGTLPTFTPDPTAQQEPPKGLYGKYRVERVDGKPIRACFVLEYLDDLHANKALLEYAFSVERVNPELAKDLRAEWGKWPGRSQQEPGESLARGLDDLAAGRVSRRDDYLEPQPEPATTHPVSPESTNCVPKPRTPRVVDRLGVDEQGSLWRNRADTEFWFQDECWNFRTKDGCTSWYTAGYEPKMRIFTEILEPRVLPSLDCEEARDGTVWEARYVLLAGRREQTPGWKFQHTQDGWVYEDGSRVLSPEFLTGRGPYTEVLPDVG